MITANQRRLLIALVVMAAGFAAIVTLLWGLRSTKRAFSAVAEKKEEQIDLAAVVTEIRSLNRLETASMRVVHVSSLKQSYGLVPQAISGDEITFMAVGDVVAGIDLSRLTERDVRFRGDTLVVRIPPSEVLLTRIDNRQSRVLKRDTGMFRRGDVDLESRVRVHAETGVRQEALKKGILPLASRNAEQRLASLVKLLGVKKVEFEKSVLTLPGG